MADDSAALAAASGSLASSIGSFGRGSPKKQYKWWKKQFAHQAAYNHPTQQMARLAEAGLNPNLVYGESTAGATGQHTQGGEIDTSVPGPESAIGGAIEGYFNTRNAQLKTEEQSIQNSLLGQQNSIGAHALQARRFQARTEADLAGEKAEFEKQSRMEAGMTTGNMQQSSVELGADAQRLSMGLVKQRYLSNQIDLQIKDASKADQIKQIANTALMSGYGATLREQETILKQAEVNLFKSLPKSAVTPILLILKMLLNR